MDIDLATSGLERIVGSDPPLDTIAHGLYFGEGPVWDRRNSRFLWTDIIGDTIWQWTPGVGSNPHPPLEPRQWHDLRPRWPSCCRGLVGAHDLARGEGRLARDHRLPLPGEEDQQSERYRRPFRRHVYWTDLAGGLVIPGMVGEDLQRQLDFQAVFRLTPEGEVELTVEDCVYPNGLMLQPGRNRSSTSMIRGSASSAPSTSMPTAACATAASSTPSRHRGRRRRRHEVRPGGQRLLHRPRRHPCHGREWRAHRSLRIPGMPPIWPGAMTTGARST